MNKVCIIYFSFHHQNTKKLIFSYRDGIDFFDVLKVEDIDFSKYEIVGFASGIYMGKMNKILMRFIYNNINKLNKVFIIYTCGSGMKLYGKKIKNELNKKNINVIDFFSCKGFDTYGPWKIIGGISKNHPNNIDCEKYRSFIIDAKNNV